MVRYWLIIIVGVYVSCGCAIANANLPQRPDHPDTVQKSEYGPSKAESQGLNSEAGQQDVWRKHVEFLRDKLDYYAVIIAILVAVLSLASVAITIAAGWKFVKCEYAYRDSKRRMDAVIADAEKYRKGANRLASENFVIMAKSLFEQYRDLSSINSGNPAAKQLIQLRCSFLVTFCTNITQAITHLTDVGDARRLYLQLALIESMTSTCKVDVRAVKGRTTRLLINCRLKDVCSIVSRARISSKRRRRLLAVYESFLRDFGIKYM